MGHDDDSAEVSRVNRDGYGEYETLFRCCGRTVQGEGDMGPPDGWCFEGQHTVRASGQDLLHLTSLTSRTLNRPM